MRTNRDRKEQKKAEYKMVYVPLIKTVRRANNIVEIRTGKVRAQNKQHFPPLTVTLAIEPLPYGNRFKKGKLTEMKQRLISNEFLLEDYLGESLGRGLNHKEAAKGKNITCVKGLQTMVRRRPGERGCRVEAISGGKGGHL